MALWRVSKFLALALTVVAVKGETNSTFGVARRLGAAPGNVGACYTPHHNSVYPLNGRGYGDPNAIRAAIEADFALLSQHVTHVRTYHAMHYGVEIAPIAKKYGLKLYLGVFMTNEPWGVDEIRAAINAVKYHSDAVEVVLVGNENLHNRAATSGSILAKVNEIKAGAGPDAGRVKYGTVQRINEFVENTFSWDMQNLNNNLDILGVNIYPFFNNGYNGARPTELLDAQWNMVMNRFPRHKIRLTETGFPTAGAPSQLSRNIIPNLEASINYYEGVVNWRPAGYDDLPKFWFQAFDRRHGDATAFADYELYFGFFRTDRSPKRAGFPRAKGGVQGPPSPGGPGNTQQFCMENGVDYIGNDVGNARSPNADGCVGICRERGGCGAFTWSNHNGGTCWLKSTRGQVKTNAEVRSGSTSACAPVDGPAPVRPPEIPTDKFCMEAGVDYIGNDIGNAASGKPDGCVSICSGRADCRAFTWSNHNGGTCWLKSSRSVQVRFTAGVHSGSTAACSPADGPAPVRPPEIPVTAAPAPQPAGPVQCGLEANVDFVGNDIGNAGSADPAGCVRICRGRQGCGAFTWSNHAGGTCWLKSSRGQTRPGSGVTSGVPCPCLEVGVDFTGNDIGSAASPTPQGCNAICMGRANCQAFSWTFHQGGVCWLKSARQGPSVRGGVVSGVRCE